MTYVKTYLPTLKAHVVNLKRDAKDLSRDLQRLEVRGKLGSKTLNCLLFLRWRHERLLISYRIQFRNQGQNWNPQGRGGEFCQRLSNARIWQPLKTNEDRELKWCREITTDKAVNSTYQGRVVRSSVSSNPGLFLYEFQGWPTLIFSLHHQYIINRKGLENQ